MSEIHDGAAHDHGPHQHAHAAPTTEQLRTVGQRRREAEEKLEHHLEEARHKGEHPHGPLGEPETETAGGTRVDGGDVAGFQHDDRQTPADRADTIAHPGRTEADGDDIP